MKYGTRWVITGDKKEEYISRLLPHLSVLRAKSGLSQGELASLVGISRQTYCLTETGARTLSWGTYLSLLMFFDCNAQTHDLIHSMGIYPNDLICKFNQGAEDGHNLKLCSAAPELEKMLEGLDENGRNAVRAVICAEYARCAGLTGAEMLKALSDVIV